MKPAGEPAAFLAERAGTAPVGIGLRELLSRDVDEPTGLLTNVTPAPGPLAGGRPGPYSSRTFPLPSPTLRALVPDLASDALVREALARLGAGLSGDP